MSNAIVLGLPIAGLVLVSIPRLGHVQTSTRDEQESLAGVKDYRLTYQAFDYKVRDTYLLAAFRPDGRACIPCAEREPLLLLNRLLAPGLGL